MPNQLTKKIFCIPNNYDFFIRFLRFADLTLHLVDTQEKPSKPNRQGHSFCAMHDCSCTIVANVLVQEALFRNAYLSTEEGPVGWVAAASVTVFVGGLSTLLLRD